MKKEERRSFAAAFFLLFIENLLKIALTKLGVSDIILLALRQKRC